MKQLRWNKLSDWPTDQILDWPTKLGLSAYPLTAYPPIHPPANLPFRLPPARLSAYRLSAYPPARLPPADYPAHLPQMRQTRFLRQTHFYHKANLRPCLLLTAVVCWVLFGFGKSAVVSGFVFFLGVSATLVFLRKAVSFNPALVKSNCSVCFLSLLLRRLSSSSAIVNELVVKFSCPVCCFLAFSLT